MYMDQANLFDTAAAITATAVSTNIIDLTNARDLGVGDDPALDVVVLVTTTMLSAGATTLTIQFQGSTDNSTYTTMMQSDTLGKAVLTAGTKISFDMPRLSASQARPRYLRLNYVVATGPFTQGAVTSFLCLDDHANTGIANYGYAPGIVIAN
jgi:hypothetical protein